jgi:hypothetical protein
MILVFRFRGSYRTRSNTDEPPEPPHRRLLVILKFSDMQGHQSKRMSGSTLGGHLNSQLVLIGQTCPPRAQTGPWRWGQFAVTLEVCRLERGSEVKRALPGDLNRLFYRVNVHFKSSSNVGIGYQRSDFARMLRGEIQQQDRFIDLCLSPRMHASDPRRPVLSGRACAPQPRRGSAGAPGPSLEIDDVCH